MRIYVRSAVRAVDPHSLYADPDPAVFLNADPDPDPDPGPGPCSLTKFAELGTR